MIGRPELIAIINTAHDAVNASKVGPLVVGEDENGHPKYNSLAYNALLYSIQKMVPQAFDATYKEIKDADGDKVIQQGAMG